MATNIIALSGAHGLIGSMLKKKLEEQSFEVWPLVRSKGGVGRGQIAYDYKSGFIEAEKLKECHAVIHLAGKNIFSGLWTARFKRELYDSRVLSTELIAQAMAQYGPRILLNASAAGYYGDRGDSELDEGSSVGEGFLSELCYAWEQATLPAKKAGVRVVNLRFGIVVSPEGGMIGRLEPLFKAGLGGKIGSGQHYMALVDLDDVVAGIIFALNDNTLSGPINIVAPEALTNKDFTEMLGLKLKRPTWLTVPAWGLRLLGEQGAMVLSSARIYPRVLLEHGFRFSCLNWCEMLRKF